MHRSGTSIAARALDTLGVSFGEPELLMRPGPDNEAGYWENISIKELDNDLLAHLGGSWDSPPVLEPGWADDPGLEEFRVRGAEVLDTAFGPRHTRTIFGFKDPRLSLLLPFWRTLTPVTATIVLVREPTEVAASLWKRDEIPPPQACLLWLRYLLAAIENDLAHHLLVNHQAIFEDPAGTLATMANHLSLPVPDDRAISDATSHLDQSLRHHIASTFSLQDGEQHNNPIVALALAVWNRGDISTEALDVTTARALAHGWLRPPVDTEAFDRARARNVDLTELFRRRSRKRRQSDEAQAEGDHTERDDTEGAT